MWGVVVLVGVGGQRVLFVLHKHRVPLNMLLPGAVDMGAAVARGLSELYIAATTCVELAAPAPAGNPFAEWSLTQLKNEAARRNMNNPCGDKRLKSTWIKALL